jgi:hypothetical protein
VVGAQQHPPGRQRRLGQVPEAGLGPDRAEVAQGGVPGEGTQGDDHGGVGQQGQLLVEPGGAGVALGDGRLVVGRRALDRGRDPAVGELEPVVARDRGRLVGVTGPVQAGEQPVARAVAGENSPGAVAAVGGGRQTEDQEAPGRVAESGYRPAPVLPVPERGPLVPGHLLAPGHQARAAPAPGDLHLEFFEPFQRLHPASRHRPSLTSPIRHRHGTGCLAARRGCVTIRTVSRARSGG